ncbi:AraC family transcriptional regulator [Pigmentiphaga kullae]|uniref:AraC family transcriptional regulator n=1 Tax=Pigmentiphaga kullae TaxID=151784 RepID=A0A4Q7NDF8_9BURK|nr:AraC family transcriptional regulator [Pigmentiphaga kullae]RZS81098.1 AraC family transcriptional regulator [Pigmentiphaga kullae]
MDALSEVLAICRCERAVTARFTLSGPWSLQSTGVSGAMIRMVAGRPYWMQVEDDPPFLVQPGDLVMLPHGSAHVMCSDPGLPPTPFRELIERYRGGPEEDTPFVMAWGGGGEVSTMFSTLAWFSTYCRSTVMAILPRFIHLRASDVSVGGGLAGAMHLLVDESLARRSGWKLAAARLADLLLVHILREHLESRHPHQANWLRGLTHKSIASAIALMHREPAQDWTLASLADAVHMSRSRFSALFAALVGMTPMDYLFRHRMAAAAGLLEERRMPLIEVAERVGYTSEKAFSRAFTRWAGYSPARHVQRGNGPSA